MLSHQICYLAHKVGSEEKQANIPSMYRPLGEECTLLDDTTVPYWKGQDDRYRVDGDLVLTSPEMLTQHIRICLRLLDVLADGPLGSAVAPALLFDRQLVLRGGQRPRPAGRRLL
jgi:hypothetical protein